MEICLPTSPLQFIYSKIDNLPPFICKLLTNLMEVAAAPPDGHAKVPSVNNF